MCPIFTNPVDWLKTLSNGVKTHLLKLKASKFSRGGYALPAPPPRSCGEAGKGLQGKILGDGNNERRKGFSPFLIFNLNK